MCQRRNLKTKFLIIAQLILLAPAIAQNTFEHAKLFINQEGFEKYARSVDELNEVKIKNYYNYSSSYDTVERTDQEIIEEVYIWKHNDRILKISIIPFSQSGDWAYLKEFYFNQDGRIIGIVETLLEHNNYCYPLEEQTGSIVIQSHKILTSNDVQESIKLMDAETKKAFKNKECYTKHRWDGIRYYDFVPNIENCNIFEKDLQNRITQAQLFEVEKNEILEYRDKQLNLARISNNGMILDLNRNKLTSGNFKILETPKRVYNTKLIESKPHGITFQKIHESSSNIVLLDGLFQDKLNGIFTIVSVGKYGDQTSKNLGTISLQEGHLKSLVYESPNDHTRIDLDDNKFDFSIIDLNRGSIVTNVSLQKFQLKEPLTLNGELQIPLSCVEVDFGNDFKISVTNNDDVREFLTRNEELRQFCLVNDILPIRIFSTPSNLYMEFSNFNVNVKKYYELRKREIFDYQELFEYVPEFSSSKVNLDEIKQTICGWNGTDKLVSSYNDDKDQFSRTRNQLISQNEYIVDFTCKEGSLKNGKFENHAVIDFGKTELDNLSIRIRRNQTSLNELRTNFTINKKYSCPIANFDLFKIDELDQKEGLISNLTDKLNNQIRSGIIDGEAYQLIFEPSSIKYSGGGDKILLDFVAQMNLKLIGNKFSYDLRIVATDEKLVYTLFKLKGDKLLSKIEISSSNSDLLTAQRDCFNYVNGEWKIQSNKSGTINDSRVFSLFCLDNFIDFYNPKTQTMRVKYDPGYFVSKILSYWQN